MATMPSANHQRLLLMENALASEKNFGEGYFRTEEEEFLSSSSLIYSL